MKTGQPATSAEIEIGVGQRLAQRALARKPNASGVVERDQSQIECVDRDRPGAHLEIEDGDVAAAKRAGGITAQAVGATEQDQRIEQRAVVQRETGPREEPDEAELGAD